MNIITNSRKTKQGNQCIIPFEHQDTTYTDCKPEFDGSSKCPTKKTKKSYLIYEDCEELEYDEVKLLENYQPIIKDHKLVANQIEKRKIMTLPRVVELANKDSLCKGFMWNNDKKKYTIHSTSALLKKPGFNVYLKKGIVPKTKKKTKLRVINKLKTKKKTTNEVN